MSWGAHIQGWLWDHSLLWRKPARRLLDRTLDLRTALARRTGKHASTTPTVRHEVATSPGPHLQHPALVAIPDADDQGQERLSRFLEGQTETSVTIIDGVAPIGVAPTSGAPTSGHYFLASGGLDSLPATHLEGLLLAAAAEDLAWIRGGWATPGGAVFDPPAGTGPSSLMLVRPPAASDPTRLTVVGRDLPHVTDPRPDSDRPDPDRTSTSTSPRSGPYHLGTSPGRPTTTVYDVHQRLFELPAIDGPPTALFLLPYLAVGGAERQLLDVLDEWGDAYRCLIVTLEPHGDTRGHMLDAFRDQTPHVYPLGDWLPREAHDGVVRHLLRRYQVVSLVGWNGTVLFYDAAGAWRRDFPLLRISNQVYNHEDGWISHYGPRVRHAVDMHFAVNRRIGAAMEHRHGVDPSRITVIHPAARVVPLPKAIERAQNQRARRRALDLPTDDLVVGTFIRLHPQKRPLDILALARRFNGRGVTFLLVGGGPLDDAVDEALAAEPTPNLVRLGLRHDVEALYEALDICLMTSAFEGLPVFLLDGLARAIPCVTTAVGDIPLLLENGGGIAIDQPGDLDALEAGIETMRNPERRAAEGARGHATVAARFHMLGFAARYRQAIFPDD